MKNTIAKFYLCSIWKNEGRGALEWLAFHMNLGFSCIHIYDNNSIDGSRELLASLAQAGVIRHTVWDSIPSGESPQVSAYRSACAIAKNEGFDWILFIDADEFLVPHKQLTISELMNDICTSDDISAVAFNWKTFGSSGHVKYSKELVIDKFNKCANGFRSPNNCVKSIVRLDRLIDPHIHLHEISSGRYINDRGELGQFHDRGMTKNPSYENAQINHYMVKSKEEFIDKRGKGNANRHDLSLDKFDRIGEEYFVRFDLNDVEDHEIYKFRDGLVAKIEELKSKINLKD